VSRWKAVVEDAARIHFSRANSLWCGKGELDFFEVRLTVVASEKTYVHAALLSVSRAA
jgi:hypothetical protein